jgi:hypothetical protein
LRSRHAVFWVTGGILWSSNKGEPQKRNDNQDEDCREVNKLFGMRAVAMTGVNFLDHFFIVIFIPSLACSSRQPTDQVAQWLAEPPVSEPFVPIR